MRERDPGAYENPKAYEKLNTVTGERFSLNQREIVEELEEADRLKEIWEKHEKMMKSASSVRPGDSLFNILGAALDEEDDTEPCAICSL